LNFIHGPDGGTQRSHSIYSYVGDFRVFADGNENLELRGANIIMKNGNNATRATLSSGGDMTLADGGFVSKTGSHINVSVDTHGWSQDTFYDIIGSNVFGSFTDTYLVQFQWSHEGHGSPYIVYGNFLFTPTGANHTGATGRTFQPVQVGHSFHGPNRYFEFRAYATGQVRPGIQAVARGFSPSNNNNYGYMEVRATRIAAN